MNTTKRKTFCHDCIAGLDKRGCCEMCGKNPNANYLASEDAVTQPGTPDAKREKK
jgi:hypothetical protein